MRKSTKQALLIVVLVWAGYGALVTLIINVAAKYTTMDNAIPIGVLSPIFLGVVVALLWTAIAFYRDAQRVDRERPVVEHRASVSIMLDDCGLHVQLGLDTSYCQGHCKLEFGTGPGGEDLAWIAHVNGTRQEVPTEVSIDGVTHQVSRYITAWGGWYGCQVPDVKPPWAVEPTEEAGPAPLEPYRG